MLVTPPIFTTTDSCNISSSIHGALFEFRQPCKETIILHRAVTNQSCVWPTLYFSMTKLLKFPNSTIPVLPDYTHTAVLLTTDIISMLRWRGIYESTILTTIIGHVLQANKCPLTQKVLR